MFPYGCISIQVQFSNDLNHLTTEKYLFRQHCDVGRIQVSDLYLLGVYLHIGYVVQGTHTLYACYFRYPQAVLIKPIYTTNSVETAHCQFRTLTKSGVFTNKFSLSKFLYIGIRKASEKWAMSIQSCGQTLLPNWICSFPDTEF